MNTIKEEITIDEDNIRVKVEEKEDEPELKKLKKQVDDLSAVLLKKDKLIKNLRQKVWQQQKQLFRYQCAVKNFRKKKKLVVLSQ